ILLHPIGNSSCAGGLGGTAGEEDCGAVSWACLAFHARALSLIASSSSLLQRRMSTLNAPQVRLRLRGCNPAMRRRIPDQYRSRSACCRFDPGDSIVTHPGPLLHRRPIVRMSPGDHWDQSNPGILWVVGLGWGGSSQPPVLREARLAFPQTPATA